MATKSQIRKRLLELYNNRDHLMEDDDKEIIQAQIDILVWVLSNKKGELQL